MKLRTQALLVFALVALIAVIVVLSSEHESVHRAEPTAAAPTISTGQSISVDPSASASAPAARAVPPVPLARVGDTAHGGLVCIFVAALDGRTPVAGVLVRCGLVTLAIADAHGRCNLSADAAVLSAGDPDSKVVASAEGFATTVLDLSAALTGQRDFHFPLEPSATIAGHVRWTNGQPIPSGGRVVAWTDESWLTVEAVRALLAGRASAHLFTTSTDEHGAFRFHGLAPTQNYSVLGLGCGWITRSQPAPEVRPSEEPLELTASGVYGAFVQVRDARGEPLSTSPRLFGSGPSWDADVDGAESLVSSAGRMELLAACDPLLANHLQSVRRNSWDSTLLLYARPDGTEGDLGPVDFAVTVPGFEMLRRDLTLPWLGRSIVTHTLVPLARTTCVGACSVPKPERVLSRGAQRGTLVLHSPLIGETWSAALDLSDPESLVLEGVPCGEYVAQFRAYDSYAQWPQPGEPSYAVRIVEHEHVSIPIDMDHTGALELELVDERGLSYTGDWRINLEQGPLEAYTSIGVELGPNRRVVGLIDPGEYRIRVESMASRFEVLMPTSDVTIVRGRTTSHVIPIRRRKT